MTNTPAKDRVESLDPDDWDALAQLGHRMVDDMIEQLRTVRERPAWQPIPADVKSTFLQELPAEPQNAEQVYEDFGRYIRPYLRGNTHPRFWAWVEGAGSPFAALAEMLAASLNCNVSFGEQAPVYAELQVLDWCKQMLGYPAEASGLLVSGGSEAGLIALTVARNAKAKTDIARDGLATANEQLIAYGSTETHSSIQKALEIIGLGSNALRRVPVGPDFSIDVQALELAIQEDRLAGKTPFCLIGNAGTVNTGAIDDLTALAEIARAENLWFHIDGAFGAIAALAPATRHLVNGMTEADSLAFDLHKWLSVPYEAGCILIRDSSRHHRTFSASAAYLPHVQRGVAGGPIWFAEYGLQLSRSFKALKVWMMFKHYGINKYARIIQRNIDQARYLESLIKDAHELELLAPVSLNVVCFRFKSAGLVDSELNQLNEEITLRIQEAGMAIPSSTVLHGKYAIRVAITNHRSQDKDFERLIEAVLNHGRALLDEMSGERSRDTNSPAHVWS